MNSSIIEENLLILLDPASLPDEAWHLIRNPRLTDISTKHKVVLCFSRSNLIRYFLSVLVMKFAVKSKRVRKILYINDGLLCCLFYADNGTGYRAFAKRHVAAPHGIKQKILKLLPPVLQAEQLYIAVEDRLDDGRLKGSELPKDLDFMFYSNAPGKLLLTRSETFISGIGVVCKTTSSPEYADNLQREYEAVCSLPKSTGQPLSVPDVGMRLRVNSRCYYPEMYLSGENLRSSLRNAGHRSSLHEAIHFLDRLDNWFIHYHTSFQGVKKTLGFLYSHLIQKLYELHRNDSDVEPIIKYAEELLAGIDNWHGGVVPVLAHNDLWPGNFIINGDRLTAIDWERAKPERAPLFDYFWMIISAVMEYRVGQNGVQDYSIAFRQFLSLDDNVCRHARSKLECFLMGLGFGTQMFYKFVLLFLMEWSIQGACALGKTTDMDRLAQGELITFIRDYPDGVYGRTEASMTGSP